MTYEIWPFRPNWASPWRTTVEYKTEIIESRSGKEQRRALRSVPRKSVEFTILVKDGAYIDLKRQLARWQNGTFIVPDVTRQAVLASPVVSGSPTLPVIAMPWWAVAGADIVIQVPDAPYKWRQSIHGIQSISGTTITLSDNTSTQWPPGALIHPALVSLTQPDVTINSKTSTIAEATIRFDVDPGSEPAVMFPFSTTTFQGREVLTFDTNWRSEPVTNYLYPFEQVDFGRGRISTVRPISFGSASRRFQMLAKTAAEAESHLAQFMRMKGQRGEFYMDSGEPDIIPLGTTTTGNNVIKVSGSSVYDTYAEDTVHKALLFVMKDGTLHRTRVSTINLNGADSDIVIESTLGQPVSVNTIDRISWLRVCRHATDTFTLDWVTDSVAETQMTVKTLESLAAE